MTTKLSMTGATTGVACYKCGGRLKNVIDSRADMKNGMQCVRRRRVCENCNSRATTFEISEKFFDQIEAALAAVGRMIK